MTGAAELFRAVGLRPDGPAVLGRPVREAGPGVYVIELPAPLATAPIEITRLGKWIERLPDLRLDGERPTSKALAARLASFWLPRETVLFIGAAETSVGGRVTALERHVLGDRRPHAAGQWLKTLAVDGLRVWWAPTTAHEEYEDGLVAAFAEGVTQEDRQSLPDPAIVLPFANLRAPGGPAKPHGLRGAVPAAEVVAPSPAGRVVDLPPGDAEGARVEKSGSRIRPPRSKPASAPGRTAPAASRSGASPRRAAATTGRQPVGPPAGRQAEPLLVTADGFASLQAEHASLVARRPEVVARIKAAKELGDLKENADYTAAREEQGFLEGRIQAIEAQLRVIVVADAPAGGSRVVHGSRVRVETDGDEVELRIVGGTESNPGAGRISAASPVGKALLGRSVGDDAVVTTPGGEVRYRVLAID
jgi:transcription elongation factor GreA